MASRLTVFFALLLSMGVLLLAPVMAFAANEDEEYPSVRLRSLDKITARTLTFDAKVGTTIKFGEIYIKIQSCRKPPPIIKTEASAFLQIWEMNKTTKQSHWVYSGWMFASSPALSGMDHPVYDVWVIDCLGKDPEALPETQDGALPDEGTVPEGVGPAAPDATPDAAQTENFDTEAAPDDKPAATTETPAAETPAQDTPSPAPAPAMTPAPAEKPTDGDSLNGIY